MVCYFCIPHDRILLIPFLHSEINMKRLYILRHSKAGQSNKRLLDDHERTLTGKGIDLCSAVSEQLQVSDKFPEVILCSTAIRAKETTKLVLENIKESANDAEVKYLPKLYLASPDDILNIIRDIDDDVESVMVVGHNPGLQQFSMNISGSGDKKKFREMRGNFPPASLAVFDINNDNWADTKNQSAELVDFQITRSI